MILLEMIDSYLNCTHRRLYMSEQIIIRVKVDRELKEQATDILDQIGISIPVAVRMFLKATVREKGLPILTKAAWKPSDEEQQVEYIRNRLLYQAPLHSDSETVALLPLERGKRIPAATYSVLISPNICPRTRVPSSDSSF